MNMSSLSCVKRPDLTERLASTSVSLRPQTANRSGLTDLHSESLCWTEFSPVLTVVFHDPDTVKISRHNSVVNTRRRSGHITILKQYFCQFQNLDEENVLAQQLCVAIK